LITLGEDLIQKEELEQQLRALADTYKLKRKQMKQLEEDLQNMEDAYSSMNSDEKNYEDYISDKLNKIIQAEKDIDQVKEKIERATKQLIKFSSDLRKTRNTTTKTLEEKDFELRDLWDFNKNKAKELVEISNQYPLLKQTLSILFAQVIYIQIDVYFQRTYFFSPNFLSLQKFKFYRFSI
jgi:DNA repair ATPase RecN